MFLNKFKPHRLRLCARLKHKENKQNEEIQIEKGAKYATDLMNYLESNEEYKNIIPCLPKVLLKKYKTPETMYIINKNTARDIADTIKGHFDKHAPIVEVNPGLGFLTEAILRCQKNPVYLYESSNYFSNILNDLQQKYPERIKYKTADFFGMWKLAFQDKMDDGNRIKELLGDLATENTGRKIKIVGAMPGLSFVRHLINTIVFHNTTNQLGRPDLFIIIPVHHYEFLTDTLVEYGKHKSVPSLFQTLFYSRVLKKVPKAHFLPWIYPVNKKVSVIDEHFLYLVNITQKETLPCPPDYLPLLWYFFKPHTFSKTSRVIPVLEQWIPGCGVWLITGQDPPDVNKDIAPGPNDAKLPHMTIFTQFGDLTLQQKITVFKRFVSWPEFEQCPFRAAMDNNLPKFAVNLDSDVKESLESNIDDLEHSDSETDHDTV
ncbi:dimethyladenosine transferase 2, mitochondrial [Colias croceus]|uniref:dimethyladenosine transferase 2, mitochondrial n=1 Tax=Colias crocea TaxID=72248 RepID=UPI001E281279|nr:dimethyladenosine transferase 2, mitochondrial [Colias croceus]